mgnify:CR=1 FL=1
MGESTRPALKVRFDRRVRLEFRGATITSDAGLLAARELDEVLALTEMATGHLKESRTGRNVQHQLVPPDSSGPSTAVWPGMRIPTTQNGWPRTRPCASSRAGGGPRSPQPAPTA